MARGIIVFVVFATTMETVCGIDYTSDRTTGGLWTDTGAWLHSPPPLDPLFPANTGGNRFFVGLGDNDVTLDVSVTVSSLDIGGGGTLTWQYNAGRQLIIDNGPISNRGGMLLNAGDALAIRGDVALSGGGFVLMTSPTSRINAIDGGRLTVNGNSITGQGLIGGIGFNLTNDGGRIVAGNSSAPLILDPGGDFTQINDGYMGATNAATLVLQNGFFNNAGGTVEALSGAAVHLSFADILGGTLTSHVNSMLRVINGTSRFDSLTISDGTRVVVDAGKTLKFTGGNTNNGQITLSNLPTLFTQLEIEATAMLSGNGTITLDHANDRIVRTSTTSLLVNGAGHTIQGMGSIGTGTTAGPMLNNQGTILANVAQSNLNVFIAAGSNSVVNSGEFVATGQGRLVIDGASASVIENQAGLIHAQDDSVVLLQDVTISGGELRTSGSGRIETFTNVHFRDLLHSSITTVGTSLFFAGQIENNGHLDLGTTSIITLDADSTLSGFGDIRLTGNARISGPLGSPLKLTNTTNDIHGAGLVGNRQISIDNQRFITADEPDSTLTVEPAPGGSVVNIGTLRADNGGTLALRSGTYQNNSHGTILAKDGATVRILDDVHLTQEVMASIRAEANATVEISGDAVIMGGQLASHTTAGQIDVDSRVRVTGSEPRFEQVTNTGFLLVDGGNATADRVVNQGLIRVTNDRQLYLEHELTLDGDVEVVSDGGTLGTVLRIREEVLLDGDAAVFLSGTSPTGFPLAQILGTGADSHLVNCATITGEGRIQGGSFPQQPLRVINKGQIVATGNLDLVPFSNVESFDMVNELTGDLIARDGGRLLIQNDINNKGFITAESGSVVVLNNTTIDATGASVGGLIEAQDNGMVWLDQPPVFGPATRILGGTLVTTGTGLIVNPTDATLDGSASGIINLNGNVIGKNGSTTTMTGSFVFGGGALRLQPSSSQTRILVAGSTSMTGAGDVILESPSQTGGLAQVTGQAGSSPQLTIGTSITVAGDNGQIGGNGLSVINQGIIRAGLNGAPSAPNSTGSMLLKSMAISNGGTMLATSAATLQIDNVAVVNAIAGSSGLILAEEDAVVELTGNTSIAGGILDTAGTGVIRTSTSASLVAPIVNQGLFETSDGATTTLIGGSNSSFVTNRGTMRLADSPAMLRARMIVVELVTLDGGGVLELADNPRNEITGGSGNHQLLRNKDNTIRGAGTIGGPNLSLANLTGGTVIAEGTHALTLIGPAGNAGTMRAQGAGGLTITPDSSQAFLNTGSVSVDAGSRLDGPEIEFANVLGGTFHIDGVAVLRELDNQNRFTGTGTLNGRLLNGGFTAPGPASVIVPSPLVVDGEFEQQSTGTLEFDFEEEILLETIRSDHLMVTGTAVLDGNLTLALRDTEAFPAPGTQFDVLTANSISGQFADVQFMAPSDVYVDGQVTYGDTYVRVQIDVATWRADFDRDLDLDGEDIDGLVAAIAAMRHDPIFDLNGDGLVNTTDLHLWLQQAGAVNLPSGHPYLLGDANLDGVVDGQDFITWNTFKFGSTGRWTAGDFNADGLTDGQDFIIWNTFKFQHSDAAGVAVPEPTAAIWSLLTLVAIRLPTLRQGI